MSKSELTDAEQKTMELIDSKGGMFGLTLVDGEWEYNAANFDAYKLRYSGCTTITLPPEAALALAEHRGLRRLAEMWDLPLSETLHLIASRLHPGCNDMLAVVIAALEEKNE